jgi:nucleoside 2-deoxyribosyltransferase
MSLVYISGALMGARDLSRARSLYKRFASACEAAGWQSYLPHESTDPQLAGEIPSEDVMQRDLERLTQSDAMVAYIGEPSLGVGAEIVLAMQQNKFILAVHDSSKPVSRFVKGLLLNYKKAHLYSYDAVDEVCEWITRVLQDQHLISA